ncbi:MAG: hypothetical protein CL878_15220 [Dehalococcoidia bacterium]|nr:hypothetical protein [Dehalococcoidia bacterium]
MEETSSAASQQVPSEAEHTREAETPNANGAPQASEGVVTILGTRAGGRFRPLTSHRLLRTRQQGAVVEPPTEGEQRLGALPVEVLRTVPVPSPYQLGHRRQSTSDTPAASASIELQGLEQALRQLQSRLDLAESQLQNGVQTPPAATSQPVVDYKTQDLLERARQEAREIVARAQQEAQGMMGRAQQEAQDYIARAQRDYQDMLARAQRESQSVLERTEREVQAVIARSRQEASGTRGQKQPVAQDVAISMLREAQETNRKIIGAIEAVAQEARASAHEARAFLAETHRTARELQANGAQDWPPAPVVQPSPLAASRPAPAAVALAEQEATAAQEEEEGPVPDGPPPEAELPLMAGSRLNVQVSPFKRFGQLATYQNALGSLSGVRDVKMRRFYKGVLHLSVDYDGVIPMTDRLAEVAGFSPESVFVEGSTIHVRLPSLPADSAGGNTQA